MSFTDASMETDDKGANAAILKELVECYAALPLSQKIKFLELLLTNKAFENIQSGLTLLWRHLSKKIGGM